MLSNVLQDKCCALLSEVRAAKYPACEAEGGGLTRKPHMSNPLIGK
jgi:hypothetical protein